MLVFLLAVGATASVIWRLEQHRLEEDRLRVAELSSDYAQAIQRHIEHALSAAYALAALVHQGNGVIPDFEAVATQMLPFYPGVASLNLSPNGIVQQIAPLAGHEKAIGFNQLQDPAENKEAFLARDTGKLTLAGPFELVEGGLGAVGRLPVFLDDAIGSLVFWGFTNVVIRFPEALDPARLPQLTERGFAYQLWRIHPDTGKREVIATSSANPLIDPVERTVLVPNGRWTLSVSPVGGWNDPPGFLLKTVLGLLISLLLAYLAKVLVELKAHQQGLGTLVEQRTREVIATRHQLEIMFAAIPDPVWVKDENGVYLSCNPQFERLLGMKQVAIIGKNDYDFVDRERADQLREYDQKAILAGKSSANEEWITFTDDGYRGLFETVKTPIRDRAGNLIGVLGIARDITQRKQAEEKLRENERILREAQEVAQIGYYMTDIKTGIWQSSPVLDQIFGIDAGFIKTIENWGNLIHPEFRQKVQDSYHQSINEKLRFDETYPIIRPSDGQERWVSALGEMDYDASDQPVRLIGTIQDVTDRRRAEVDLRIAATAFEAQEGIMITDANKIILRVNQSFVETTGYSAEDVVGQTPRLLQSGRHNPAFYAAMWASIMRNGVWRGEIWNRRKSGDVYPEWLTITVVKDDNGAVTHYVGTMTDITERKAAEDRIKRLAFYDPLTHLPNRELLLERLGQALTVSARSQQQGALLLIDLDHFKTLNDTFGHELGNLLLQQVARRLLGCVLENNTVARLGGDEFVVMIEDLSVSSYEAMVAAKAIGEEILATLTRTTYLLADYQHYSTASIGITLFSGHQEGVAELLKRADFAMYQAKTAGRNTVCFFDPLMQAAVAARATLEADLRDAVREGQFLLYYQAQVDDVGGLTGAEALVRWHHPRRGMVSPAEFIPLAEETGLILPLGHWVLETACAQLTAWAAQPQMAHLTLAVNVSARQFHHPDFVAEVQAVLEYSGANPEKLKLELTESLLVVNVEDIIAKMTALRTWGVSFALDDFGTGYSSLAYLKRLPLDQLKIDQSFVREILTDPNDAAIARTIVALGHSLGLAVIAEGVETEAQRDFLARNGCHAFQGYLFGRPGPAENLSNSAQR
jgi:diguanylate cyclase (GGDEF)-like protein/PAS domain S-box-containing protein